MLRRKPRRDPVSPELHDEVIERDLRLAGGCVAAFLDPLHACRDRWGYGHPASTFVRLTLDHVQDNGGRMGKRAPSDLAHLVSLCYDAHVATGWATSHRPLLREYIERANRADCGHVDPVFGCSSCQRRADPLTVGLG